MAEHLIPFTRGLSLYEAISILEGNDMSYVRSNNITGFPPINATGNQTDEDSGDEEAVNIDNLPAAQLQAPAEIELYENIYDSSSYESEDNQPLYLLAANSKEKTKNKKSIKKINYSWVKEDLVPYVPEFEILETNEILNTPYELFSKFFDKEVIDLIVTQSNRYAQLKNFKGNIEESEVKAFIGVLILSGYVQLPRRRMYWEREKDSHNELVSEAITRDRFEHIFTNLHVCDNSQLDQADKYAKVRPLFTLLNKKFMENAPVEEMHSIDEAMVPYYGRHSCKQFIHGKPIRYGYKLWVGTTRLGYLNWFEPYQGAATNISETYADFGVGAGVVLEYAQALRVKWPDLVFHLFFDNFFTSIPLIEELTKLNFYATGTARENRLKGADLINSKEIRKNDRGSYDFKKISNQNIIAVKWHDNSVVCVSSNAAGVEPLRAVKRFSQKEKKTVQVLQPHLINLYNANMGGVDRSDQNISLYRVGIRGKKWYMPLLTHCIDMAIQNAWQLHRKSGGKLTQLNFRRSIATTMLVQNKKSSTYQKGHQSSEGTGLRYDRLDHLVSPQTKQTRCGHCHAKTTTRCSKCDIGVHVKCFTSFHTKK